uniref:Uncharacterized protein n=1 Tax=Trichogramma kaykai TaxID=54128 RepID=A0ABD2XIW4_9HYME
MVAAANGGTRRHSVRFCRCCYLLLGEFAIRDTNSPRLTRTRQNSLRSLDPIRVYFGHSEASQHQWRRWQRGDLTRVKKGSGSKKKKARNRPLCRCVALYAKIYIWIHKFCACMGLVNSAENAKKKKTKRRAAAHRMRWRRRRRRTTTTKKKKLEIPSELRLTVFSIT